MTCASPISRLGRLAATVVLLAAVVLLGCKSGVPWGGAADERERTRMNLRQVGIALHHYHMNANRFPSSLTLMGRNKHPWSWRIAVLGSVEPPGVLEKFKFEEPWDSEHNLKVTREHMPAIFATGEKSDKRGMTYFRGFRGNGTVFSPDVNGKNPATLEKMSSNIGASNTTMLFVAPEPVLWTDPNGDYDYDPKKPLPKLGGFYEESVMLLMADGEIRTTRDPIDENAWRSCVQWDSQRRGVKFTRLPE